MRRTVLALILLALILPSPTPAMERSVIVLQGEVESLLRAERGMVLGMQIWRKGSGVIYSREASRPMAAASAIKTVIALDLIAIHGDALDATPVGADVLLRHGGHPAFRGFSAAQLEAARRELRDKTYWDLTKIMMGRTEETNDVYNAACNLVLIKLGGPEAVTRRVRAMDPAFAGFTLNRYMRMWEDHDDNRATPESLVALYRMVAMGHVPGLARERLPLLRELLLEAGDGTPGSVYEKGGTLYPSPMVRVHAGYIASADGDLVYAIMGEIPESQDTDPASQFVRLMTGVDRLTENCRAWARP